MSGPGHEGRHAEQARVESVCSRVAGWSATADRRDDVQAARCRRSGSAAADRGLRPGWRVRALSPGCNRHWEERNRVSWCERDQTWAFCVRTANDRRIDRPVCHDGAASLAYRAERPIMLVAPDGYGFVYVPGPRFCACGRIEVGLRPVRASCPKPTPRAKTEESDIVVAGR